MLISRRQAGKTGGFLLWWLVAGGLILAVQSIGSAAPGDTIYTQPGQLVSANETRLNFYCMGNGSPAVVFDSGWEDWAPAWAVVQPQVAKWTRACSYDRAGAGFSDAGPMPRTSVRIADELHSALHNAGIDGPYILVGHAFGGDNVRVFADRYMSEVAGLVLVEADPSDVEPKAMQDEDHRGHAGTIAGLRKCREAVAAGKTLPLLPTSPGQPARTCAQQFFRGLPESAWSPELNAALLELAQHKVALYDAYISEMEEMPRDELYLQQHRRSFGSRPIRIITTGNHAVGTLGRSPTSLKHLKYEYEIALAQARWLDLSSNAKQVFTRNSSEYAQFDEPTVVVDAIREVFDHGK
jgi:pimeloyl-ACP methyl ester carboxylesterase